MLWVLLVYFGFACFETRSHSAAQAGLKLIFLQLPMPESWDSRPALQHVVLNTSSKRKTVEKGHSVLLSLDLCCLNVCALLSLLV